MASTIRNPIEWGADQLGRSATHLGDVAEAVRGREGGVPRTRKLTFADLGAALRAGLDDLGAFRSDVLMLVLIYPVIGVAAIVAASDLRYLPLLFPAAAGFALVGPFAAIGLYEMSRRREQGLPGGWAKGLGVLSSPNFGAILMLGLALVALFLVWLGVARVIHDLTVGPEAPLSLGAFIDTVVATPEGWTMAALGIGTGAVFAVAVLSVSIVSFPLLLDRAIGLRTAVTTSVRVTLRSPLVVLSWGVIVSMALVVGSLPAFLGLIVVLPVLGHATWHLYRRAVVVEDRGTPGPAA